VLLSNYTYARRMQPSNHPISTYLLFRPTLLDWHLRPLVLMRIQRHTFIFHKFLLRSSSLDKRIDSIHDACAIGTPCANIKCFREPFHQSLRDKDKEGPRGVEESITINVPLFASHPLDVLTEIRRAIVLSPWLSQPGAYTRGEMQVRIVC
jgi:hypothetical protein